MLSSVSDKLKSFIFQPSHELQNTGASRKRKRVTDETDGQDSDIEIIEVKKARRESTSTKVWGYLTLPVQKMAQWVRQRNSSSFSSDFGVRELPENSRWKQGPPRHTDHHQPGRPSVKVPTTNGGSTHSMVLGRPPLHRQIPSAAASTAMSEQPCLNGDQNINHQEVQADIFAQPPRRQRLFPAKRNRGLCTAQECVRLDEKNRYRELLQTFAPSTQLDETGKEKEPERSSNRWRLPSTFSFGSNNSFLGNSYLGGNNSISSNSVFASELKAKPATPRPPVSSTVLTTRRKKSLDVLQSTPLPKPVKEERDLSKLRIHQQEVVILDDDDDEVKERISPILDRRQSYEFKTSPYATEEWLKDMKTKYSADVRERKRQIAEAEVKKTVFEEMRKKREDNLEQMIRERMKLEAEEPPVLEEPPPVELEKEEEEEKLPEITDEMQNVINGAMQGRPPDQVLVEGFRLQICRRDMATLVGLNWLNDEIINFYMNMLMERGETEGRAKVYAFNTFFYPKLMSGGHAAVRRWTRKVDVFSFDYILVPVHLGVHWCLSVIDFKKKKIRYFDSMGGKNTQCLQALKKYLADESQDKKKQSYNFTGWELVIEPSVKSSEIIMPFDDGMKIVDPFSMRSSHCGSRKPMDIPQQMNGSDCGMFACKFAEYITRESPITFTQENMPYFRKRMVYEIVKKKLLQ